MNSRLEGMKRNNLKTIGFVVNGDHREVLVSSNDTLLAVLRNQLDLTGTKYGCGTGDCCACTVHIDGISVLSCLSLATEVNGKEVTTVEGIADDDLLHPIQKSFVEKGAAQCGFCTPGMIMVIKSWLDENSNFSEKEARQYLRGNLCRCTGYTKIIDAALDAAKTVHGASSK